MKVKLSSLTKNVVIQTVFGNKISRNSIFICVIACKKIYPNITVDKYFSYCTLSIIYDLFD